MGRGSNFIRNAGPPADASGPASAPPPNVTCRPAAPDEVATALRLVLGSAGAPADDAHVFDFAQFAARRGIDVAQTWLADVGGELAWAVLPIVSPGRTMLLLGPSGAPRHAGHAAAAGMVVDAVCAHFAGRGVQLAQVLLDPPDTPSHRLYERQGFARVAQLVYLQVAARRRATPPPVPAGFQWARYGQQSHAAFRDLIARTYHQSLDCPTLNGLRDMEDVLAGHKASGTFDAGLWMLLCEGDAPRGALLLSRAQPADALELVYLGLAPDARGRGLGDLMMRQALAITAASGAGRLSLAVDSNNVPALKLYYRHGMQRVGAKMALMRQLRARDASGD